MDRRTLGALFAATLLGLGPFAHAQERVGPVGEWVGQVSWSEWPVVYSWAINADRTFSSGREGRGHDGGGEWSARGARLTLKYEDGFRYEGELIGDAYSGTAYAADGRAFGSFSMSRASERSRNFETDEQK